MVMFLTITYAMCRQALCGPGRLRSMVHCRPRSLRWLQHRFSSTLRRSTYLPIETSYGDVQSVHKVFNVRLRRGSRG